MKKSKIKFPTDNAYFIGTFGEGKYAVGHISKYSNQGVGTRYGTKEEAVIECKNMEISYLKRKIQKLESKLK